MFAAIIKHVNSGTIKKILGPFDEKHQADQAGLDETRIMCTTSKEYITGCPEFMYVVELMVNDRPKTTLYLVTDGSYTERYRTDPRQPTLPTQECLMLSVDSEKDPAIEAAVADFAEHMGIDRSEIVVQPLGKPV